MRVLLSYETPAEKSTIFAFFYSSWDSVENPTKYQCGKLKPNEFGKMNSKCKNLIQKVFLNTERCKNVVISLS